MIKTGKILNEACYLTVTFVTFLLLPLIPVVFELSNSISHPLHSASERGNVEDVLYLIGVSIH